MDNHNVIRGSINGKAKYCCVPVRSKLYEIMQTGGELSAEAILAMPNEKAVAVIDSIMADWLFLDAPCRRIFCSAPNSDGKGGARMNEVRINLNEVVKVKLTDLGKDIYYHKFDEVNRRFGRIVCKPSFPKEDAEGYTKFVLWNFMEIYGEHMGMARPNVIKPLEIVYELQKEES